jgi:hypothetical protein
MEIYASWDDSAGHWTIGDYEFWSSLELAKQELLAREQAGNQEPDSSLQWFEQENGVLHLVYAGENDTTWNTWIRLAPVTVRTPPSRPASLQRNIPPRADCEHCSTSGLCPFPASCPHCGPADLRTEENALLCISCAGTGSVQVPEIRHADEAG